jgi:FtsP/CotA-like multicopper oxidase with cupredoxin domain
MSNKKLLASILSIVLAMAVLVQIPNLVLALSKNDLTSTPADSTHSASFVKKYDQQKNCATDQHTALNPSTYLTHFSCGHITRLDNGTTLRQFTLFIHEDIKVPLTLGNPETHTQPIMYNAWTFNGSIPGPTIRVTQGDHVSINVINLKTNKMTHSFHMHSIHAGNIDGTMFNNASGAIKPGGNFVYNFIASPTGLWPYHCHMMPIALHLVKGLYGHMIIDPPKPRSQMVEMNMIMNGYDLTLQPNSDELRLPTIQEANKMMQGGEDGQNVSESLPQEHDNQIYSLNGVAFYYDTHPVPIKINTPYRVYLTNMLDFDFANTFHLHGQVFQYYPTGTDVKNPVFTGDMLSLGQGDRGIMEFKYDKPGLFMIHSHFESQAGRGWEGLLHVQ